MSRHSESLQSPSLAQHFEAPEDYTGHFGWLCGYSADAIFLDDATERFTRLARSQRAHQGRIALVVLLDPGNPGISLQDSPGVAHFPIKDHANKPFRLLHAKVALLGFRHHEDRSKWQLRLIVSTGNWTRQTLEESLDLLWRIDIDSGSLSHPDADTKQACADIKAVWNLLASIQQYFDVRLLGASVNGHLSETMNTLTQVSEWIDACSKKAQGQPRVFDNRSKSLLAQLSGKIKTYGDVKRNYLAMGSGFYEMAADPKKPPAVPLAILTSLRDAGLLTAKSEVDLYVNPMACQSIATAVKPLQARGITIRSAAIPSIVFGTEVQRTLHAKFLFSANSRERSNACSSAWVYLGSGNLTHPGFAQKMGATEGNLEAGVVFAPDDFCWRKDKTTPEHLVVTNLLPIQWSEEFGDTTSLSAGSDMAPRDAVYVAPPVAWLNWHEADGTRELRTDESSAANVQVLDSVGNVCLGTETGFQWRETQPRQVRIQWIAGGTQLESLIPVVDKYGRIAATELLAIDIDEAWWQLADFPLPAGEDRRDDGEDENDGNQGKDKAKDRSTRPTSYPIRQMMELIESIAAKQTGIDEMDWVLWCNRLEQTLEQAAESAPVKYFRDNLKLNPISPLRHPAFRPSFAENCDSEPGKRYDDTLHRIEKALGVSELNSVGDIQ